MTTEKVRIINTKTGKVKFVSPLVAADIKGLFAYGYIVQNLPKKEEPQEKEVSKREVAEVMQEATDVLSDNKEESLDLLDMEVISEGSEDKPKGKPGRKPNQNK